MYNYLNERNIKSIKKKLMKGMSLTEVAEDYETSVSNIGHIVSGKSWADIVVPGFKQWQKKRATLKLKRREARLEVKKPRKAAVKTAKRKKKVVARKVKEVEVKAPVVKKTPLLKKMKAKTKKKVVEFLPKGAEALPDVLQELQAATPLENLVIRLRKKTKKKADVPQLEAASTEEDTDSVG